jgi:hypothetical protein
VTSYRTAPRQYPIGRVCTTTRCSTVLSRYNDDTICAACWGAIPLQHLPTTVGRFL